MPLKTLRVFADPYAALDHEGRPAHACPTDPAHTGPERRWVGAKLHADTALKKLDAATHEAVRAGLHEHPQDTMFEFSDEAEELPRTPYYLARLKHGELIAADAETARAAGVRFEDPELVLARSRLKAIRHWKAEKGALPPFATDADGKLLEQLEAAEKAAPTAPSADAKAAAEKAESEAKAKAEAKAQAKAQAYKAMCAELLGADAPAPEPSKTPGAPPAPAAEE